jgi:hypothetical protein
MIAIEGALVFEAYRPKTRDEACKTDIGSKNLQQP